MAYARWQVEANQEVEGATVLDHWAAAARRGSEIAQRKLDGPPFPDSLGYLWRWLLELHGRSGAHMSGLNPLSYATIRHWSELTDQYPEPHEVRALIELDLLLLDRTEEAVPEPERPRDDAWPEKRHG